MYGVGAWALWPLGWAWPVIYLAIVLAGNLLFITAVCPGCLNFGKTSCGSGFGLLAARLRPAGSRESFAPRFNAVLPVIALGWAMPMAGGALASYRDIGNGGALVIDILPIALFAFVAFGVLPWASKKECRTCAMKDRCPGARVTSEGRNER